MIANLVGLVGLVFDGMYWYVIPVWCVLVFTTRLVMTGVHSIANLHSHGISPFWQTCWTWVMNAIPGKVYLYMFSFGGFTDVPLQICHKIEKEGLGSE
jgi:hypothetical protein